MNRIAALDRLIALGWGDVPQHRIPRAVLMGEDRCAPRHIARAWARVATAGEHEDQAPPTPPTPAPTYHWRSQRVARTAARMLERAVRVASRGAYRRATER